MSLCFRCGEFPVKKECVLAHSGVSRGRLQQPSSSRECASLARSAFLFNREVPSNFPVEQKIPLFQMRRISCEIKKAAAPHTRDRQPALPPKLASACRGNSPLISVNAGSTLYLTMQSFRSNPDLRDLSCPLRHFPSLAQSSEAGSTTRT